MTTAAVEADGALSRWPVGSGVSLASRWQGRGKQGEKASAPLVHRLLHSIHRERSIKYKIQGAVLTGRM